MSFVSHCRIAYFFRVSRFASRLSMHFGTTIVYGRMMNCRCSTILQFVHIFLFLVLSIAEFFEKKIHSRSSFFFLPFSTVPQHCVADIFKSSAFCEYFMYTFINLVRLSNILFHIFAFFSRVFVSCVNFCLFDRIGSFGSLRETIKIRNGVKQGLELPSLIMRIIIIIIILSPSPLIRILKVSFSYNGISAIQNTSSQFQVQIE